MTKETLDNFGLFLGCAVFMAGIYLTFGVSWTMILGGGCYIASYLLRRLAKEIG